MVKMIIGQATMFETKNPSVQITSLLFVEAAVFASFMRFLKFLARRTNRQTL
jgi:hypothetical protein